MVCTMTNKYFFNAKYSGVLSPVHHSQVIPLSTMQCLLVPGVFVHRPVFSMVVKCSVSGCNENSVSWWVARGRSTRSPVTIPPPETTGQDYKLSPEHWPTLCPHLWPLTWSVWLTRSKETWCRGIFPDYPRTHFVFFSVELQGTLRTLLLFHQALCYLVCRFFVNPSHSYVMMLAFTYLTE